MDKVVATATAQLDDITIIEENLGTSLLDDKPKKPWNIEKISRSFFKRIEWDYYNRDRKPYNKIGVKP